MWSRNDFEDAYESYKTGSSNGSSPGWVPGLDSTWQGSPSALGNGNRGRRHSSASDGADTGIGTSCSDSVEDQSSSSTTPSSHRHLPSPGGGASLLPTANVMPSNYPSPSLSPGPGVADPPQLDMRDPRPVRRWSSLTRLPLSSPTPPGSLDPYLPPAPSPYPSSSSQGLLLRSPGADPMRYRAAARAGAGLCPSSGAGLHLSPKPTSLDLGFAALPERGGGRMGAASGGGGGGGSSPIQPAVRTQMWLSEQMELSPWQQEHQQQRERLRQEAELNQMLAGTSLPVNTLVKIKEGLLRQRELEIDRQKQQILQLHARIRENELRAQQVLQSQRGHCDDPYVLKTKEPLHNGSSAVSPLSDRMCCGNGDLGRRLAAAELEVLRLNDFLKQNTQKYTEDIRKLEEKMKTRDRYISSLKKRCQRESEQSQERQQRIETLEKYLADLPSLDQVQGQAQQLEEAVSKAQALEEQVSRLENNLEEQRALMREKEDLIEAQAKRERELVATVHSLQHKVHQCLQDGVRLPMMELKHLEEENSLLAHQQGATGQLIDQQKQQIERLSEELRAAEHRLHTDRSLSQQLQTQLKEKEEELATFTRTFHQNQRQLEGGVAVQPVSQGQLPETGPLLKEMSLCLIDLQALCSILAQRAQGQEPNLGLLLGIKAMSISAEENDNSVEAEEEVYGGCLRAKMAAVAQLRQDIDELRRTISDRYAQDMGENCITQ